ncbi:response regulator [Paenibacillus sp. LHD-38]|uniref:response regulator transcription factor n=1 Tax=Paenibacillus sp. LHD-38 TaxID=3072143 RepID=UPI00280D98E8|nr:response regulator [Paenibacillus sp. LHD-38]MDQ8736436.1 response regulator [Paenibacillus sp. LHD-38]
MYRLLIVDDEPAIVEGLALLFEQCEHLELDIWQATSAQEAIETARKMKLDLVLSDIRMPEKNGLQLIDELLAFWPSCKIIFLTGYSEFDYAYSAFQKNVENYLLKDEDDQTLIEAVEAVIRKLDEEKRKLHLLEEAMNKVEAYRPYLRKQYFEGILAGEPTGGLAQYAGLDPHTLQVDTDTPVLLLTGHIRNWPCETTYARKLEIHFAVQNLFRSTLTPLLAAEEVIYDRSQLVWFIQGGRAERLLQEEHKTDWKAVTEYLKGMLEYVQNTCQDTLGVDLTFYISRGASAWEDVHREFEFMRSYTEMQNWIAPDMTIIDLSVAADPSLFNPTLKRLSDNEHYERLLHRLELAFRDGDGDQAQQSCGQLLRFIKQDIAFSYADGMRKYLNLLLLFMSYVLEMELSLKVNEDMDLTRLFRLDMPEDWENEEKYLVSIGRLICDQSHSRQEKGMHELIEKVHQFIDANLSEDLSLIKLADVVYMNPSYFSRYYKQQTGRNVSAYIQNSKLGAAQTMLQNAKLRIQDIASHLGFTSPSYFSIFFKKMTGMTPQEYRDRYAG